MRRLNSPKRQLILGLIGASIVFVALKLAENLIVVHGISREGFTWVGVSWFVGFAMLLFWFAVFVAIGRVEAWFGAWRKPVNGAVSAAIVVVLIWLHLNSIQSVPWSVVAVAFAIGWIAEYWVEGL